MKYKIFSDIPCVAKVKEESFELDDTNFLELEDKCVIYLYPLVKGFLPTLISPDFENAKLYRNDDTTYVFPEFPTISSGENVLYKAFGNRFASLTGTPYKFTISGEDSFFSYDIKKNISSPEIINISNTPCVSANFKDKNYLLIFDGKNFIEICGDVEIDKNKVTAVSYLDSISKHGKLTKIEINNGKVQILENELLYLKNKPIKPKFIGAKNYSFLQSILVKDYNLARSYLDEKLSEKLTDEHFSKFFGEFDEILPLSINTFCLKNKNTPIGVFELKNLNGKIVDVN